MKTFGNITADGKVYLYPAKPPKELLWTDQNGHTNYWCSVQGGTTGTSNNPRTEGRQTLPNSAASFTQRGNSPVSTKWNKYPFYFKAGAYVIDNKGASTEGGWVVYESFDVFNGALQV